MADEVFEVTVGDAAAAAVGFDHEHLVGCPGVDVVVSYVGYVFCWVKSAV